MPKWPVLVAVKASGANTDLMSWTGTKIHLQKMVCGALTYRHCVSSSHWLSCALTFWSCSHYLAVPSGIVQCVQCHKWSHNTCVGRTIVHQGDQSASWTCGKCSTQQPDAAVSVDADEAEPSGKCLVNDADIALELHLALNRRSRRANA